MDVICSNFQNSSNYLYVYSDTIIFMSLFQTQKAASLLSVCVKYRQLLLHIWMKLMKLWRMKVRLHVVDFSTAFIRCHIIIIRNPYRQQGTTLMSNLLQTLKSGKPKTNICQFYMKIVSYYCKTNCFDLGGDY